MSTSAVRCIVVGEAALTLQCSIAIVEAGCDVAGVFTKDPALLAWAHSNGIAAYSPEQLAEFSESHSFDYLFSIVNGRIIPETVLGKARMAAINFHDGPLPCYAGFFSTTWALLNREREYGVTWHRMTADIDAGEIVRQRLFAVTESDTAFTLNAKCYEAGLISFAEMIREISRGSLTLVRQDLSRRTYFPRWDRPSAACLVPFEKSCSEVDAFCRALDFGPYLNPMGLPKILLGASYYGVTSHLVTPAAPAGSGSGREPGTILRASPDGLVVAVKDGTVAFRSIVELAGQPVEIPALLGRHNLQEGDWLHTPPAETARRVTEFHSEVARWEASWVKRLARMNPLRLGTRHAGTGRLKLHAQLCSSNVRARLQSEAAFFEAACAAFLQRLTGETQFTVGLRIALPDTLRSLFASAVPMDVRVDTSQSGAGLLQAVRDELAALQKRRTFAADLPARYPELRGKAAAGEAIPVVLSRSDSGTAGASEPAAPAGDAVLMIQLAPGASQIEWLYDERAISGEEVERWSRQFANLLSGLAANFDAPLASLSLMSEADVRQATREWNQTGTALETEQRVHCLFEAQARRTPDAIAISFEGQDLSYRELDQRANRLARYLQERGAGPGTLVAISTGRSLEMMVGLLGILKSGAAYVPLDASYPAERLSLMVEDSKPCLVLTEERLLGRLPASEAAVVCLDADWPEIALLPPGPFESGATGADLAYVIYTSGSTGRPKGVMITHANVANFFAGMDGVIGKSATEPPGVWLAVTSISFDISVLELFWTLARGFRVVIVGEEHKRLATVAQPALPAHAGKEKTAFSLFYFAAYDSTGVDDPYRLLMEGARFADENGFEAVWTPERHFHAFGGLYPNPSVTSAALAAITKRVQIRAGSAVLPLHHPVRLAEEWAFVDRLSGGRTGISFASGWHQRDFVLAPDNFAHAKDVMFREIETVRKLWRGEAVTYSDGKGAPAEIRILPRPAQAELPVWVTAAGNVETFRMAGERGFNLLTHLLGQSIEQLAGKITAYREALSASGRDPASGKITLMLHTFVGSTLEQVRETVRTPFTNYLKSSVDLIKNSPWSFPAFAKPGSAASASAESKPVQLTDLAPEELQALLDHSFDRYFESSGLFGTVDDCVRIVEKLQAIGVDEIGCLVDFGVDTDTVLQSLHLLKQVMDRAQRPAAAEAADQSLVAQMARYGVTHLQCTPSMAGMLVAEPATRQALGRLRKLLVGGEALPAQLAARLLDSTSAAIHNMYGPTETTVWSTTAPVIAGQASAVIGRPIANTQIYLLDADRQPVPVGSGGEIYIGGLGVARGYWNRNDLTAERFVADPFRDEPDSRMYRTGDLARYLADGRIEYLGRIDHQVKIRGFRIELGEIEDALMRHPQVKEAVVVARESQSGDKTLAAYYVSRSGEPERDLKAYLEKRLPAVMVPPALVRLDAMPLTPNGKVDRNALPEPSHAPAVGRLAAPPAAIAAANPMEGEIAAVWCEVLGLSSIGMTDNFFDLGAHSILMVQAHVQLKERLSMSFSMIDLFQFPTVRSLAAHLAARPQQPGGAPAAAPAKMPNVQTAGTDRAMARKSALARRPPMGA